MVRPLVLGVVTLALIGCAADDPLVFETTTQAELNTTAGSDADPNDDTAEDDPASDPAVFPPVADDINRPREIVDLRGREIVEIEIRDNVFDERFFRVDPATLIVFVNRGSNAHNVIAAAEGAFPEIGRDALDEAPQALVLDAPGDYPFFCSIHGTRTRGQTGYAVVGDA